jgi:hypothetical protein
LIYFLKNSNIRHGYQWDLPLLAAFVFHKCILLDIYEEDIYPADKIHTGTFLISRPISALLMNLQRELKL